MRKLSEYSSLEKTPEKQKSRPLHGIYNMNKEFPKPTIYYEKRMSGGNGTF
jgi:hypothetical protein